MVEDWWSGRRFAVLKMKRRLYASCGRGLTAGARRRGANRRGLRQPIGILGRRQQLINNQLDVATGSSRRVYEVDRTGRHQLCVTVSIEHRLYGSVRSSDNKPRPVGVGLSTNCVLDLHLVRTSNFRSRYYDGRLLHSVVRH